MVVQHLFRTPTCQDHYTRPSFEQKSRTRRQRDPRRSSTPVHLASSPQIHPIRFATPALAHSCRQRGDQIEMITYLFLNKPIHPINPLHPLTSLKPHPTSRPKPPHQLHPSIMFRLPNNLLRNPSPLHMRIINLPIMTKSCLHHTHQLCNPETEPNGQ